MHEIESRYVLLETYKRDGTAVCTPVWFVSKGGTIYIVTRDQTGKVKRLRNNAGVRLAACGIRGAVNGSWLSGTSEFVRPEKTGEVVSWRDEKYGILARLAKFLSRGRGDLIALAITLK
ncbi:MAG: PPOX class F420-dependent oxidoreductase [Nitrosopumilus sp. H13]|nr:MAG: PPOX class F420-dependent oxidoreductase [Nitrosopumilus sp. H13]